MMKRIIIATLALMAVATSCEEELTWMERWRRDIVGEWELAYAYQVNVESLRRTDPLTDIYRKCFMAEHITFLEGGRSVIDGTEGGWHLELPARVLTMPGGPFTVTGLSKDTLKYYHREHYIDSTYDCNHVYFRVR